MKGKCSDRIKEALNLRNMKPIELVERSGVKKSALSQYMSGKITEVYKSNYKFAEALGISKASISAKLNNKVDFTQSEIRKSIILLKIPENEVSLYFFNKLV